MFNRSTRLVLGVMTGIMLAAVAAAGWLAIAASGALPAITMDRCREAEALWERRGPASYTMTVRVTGSQRGVYDVAVSGGELVSVVRRETGPPPERTWYNWTAPGLLDVIFDDLIASEEMKSVAMDPSTSGMLLRGEFDQDFGYPARYRRVILGTEIATEWEIVDFREETVSPTTHKQ